MAEPPQDNLDELVRMVAEEILTRVGGGALVEPPGRCEHDARLSNGDGGGACADCDGRCVEKCAERAGRVIAAGADRLSAAAGISTLDPGIAALIDHTLLRPDATQAEIEQLCREAVQFGFAAVCVNPRYVALAVALTHGSPVKVCTVVGFPLGATLTSVKVLEAEEALKLGAAEIDMVQDIGALKSGEDERLEADMRAVVETAHRAKAVCKVILETALLTSEEKVRAALIAKEAGADFVKTSTGFSSGGATVEDVALLRAAVGEQMGIKAAGGIRTADDVRQLLEAGATRIGASASVRIMQ